MCIFTGWTCPKTTLETVVCTSGLPFCAQWLCKRINSFKVIWIVSNNHFAHTTEKDIFKSYFNTIKRRLLTVVYNRRIRKNCEAKNMNLTQCVA